MTLRFDPDVTYEIELRRQGAVFHGGDNVFYLHGFNEETGQLMVCVIWNLFITVEMSILCDLGRIFFMSWQCVKSCCSGYQDRLICLQHSWQYPRGETDGHKSGTKNWYKIWIVKVLIFFLTRTRTYLHIIDSKSAIGSKLLIEKSRVPNEN